MKPSDSPPADARQAAAPGITYRIDGQVVSEPAFRAREAQLEIETTFLEGEMVDGFVQIRKAVERGTGKPYQHVVRSTTSDGTTYEIQRVD